MNRTKTQIDLSLFPEPVAELIKDSDLYDSSCSEEARVYFIDRDGGLFLKEAPAHTLKAEADLTAYYHNLGLSAEVLHYGIWNNKDYMVTRRIPGEDCTYRIYLDDPKRLCDTTASLLRKLHEIRCASCPVNDRLQSYIASVKQGYGRNHYEPDLFAGIWEFTSFVETWNAAQEGIRYLKSDALIHGDYCLPNIILNDWQFSGYIDLGNGGIADRHIDILWGIWTLKYNLGTAAYTDRFMDAYGRDRIEPEKLCQIAAMEMIGG